MTPQRKTKEQQVIYVVWDTDVIWDEPVSVFKSRTKAENDRDKRNARTGVDTGFFVVRRFTR